MPPIARTLSRIISCTALLAAHTVVVVASDTAPEAAPVMSKWKAVDIDFSYLGMTTFYSCDSLEGKLEALLKSIGAHEKTRVSATGCESNGPSRHAFVHISAGIPVPITDHVEPTARESSKQALIKRLGNAPVLDQTEFAASRKTVDLARGSILEAGDCELMDQLAREVLPKLGTTTVSNRVSCFPGQIPIVTPPLKVDVLVKTRTADETSKPR